MPTKKNQKILSRAEINPKDTWDLEIIFPTFEAWEKSLKKVKQESIRFSCYQKTLKENIKYIHKVITEYLKLSQMFSKVNVYAMLAYSSDLTNPIYQKMYAKASSVGMVYDSSTSFFIQELLSLSKNFLQSLSKHPNSKDYRQMVRGIIRSQPHVLSAVEEKLLAEQSEYAQGFEKSFEALVNTDLRFGTVKTPEGEVPLSNSTLKILLEHKNQVVRKNTFLKYYREFKNHINVLSNLYASQVQKDCAYARIRKHSSSLQAALYSNCVPKSIYHTLIKITHKNLSSLHNYYKLRKKIFGEKKISVYDIHYNPFKPPQTFLEYDKAVSIIANALAPLGDDYIQILTKGLLKDRWVDRYESKGKRSGAFSCPLYNHPPYILMNYKKESIDSMFTLAHEAGHSMHSHLSNQNNSYAHFHYSIFEAEIASTLNEYLLYRHLIEHHENNSHTIQRKKNQIYLLFEKTKTFVSTFFRQVMFAEFEYNIHRYCKQGVPLTPDLFVNEYQKLSQVYYGKHVFLPEENGLEGLRIPHFYSSFYVYQYASGIACAYSLGKKIYKEHYQNKKQKNFGKTAIKTLNFLKSAGSRYPLESLSLAGINFSSGKIIQEAINDFKNDTLQLSNLVK